MKEFQRMYALEQDLDRKRRILDQMLALLQEAWEQFFTSLSKKENPQQFLVLVAELNDVLEVRRAQLKEPETPETK
jgi:hypothetical protein